MKKVQAASAPSHAVKQAGACPCIELQSVCSCRAPHGRPSGLLVTCMRYPLFRAHAHGPGHGFSRSHQRLCAVVCSIATNRRCAIHGCGLQHSVAGSLQRLLWNHRGCKVVAQAAVGCTSMGVSCKLPPTPLRHCEVARARPVSELWPPLPYQPAARPVAMPVERPARS